MGLGRACIWPATSASSRRLHGVRGKTEEGEGWSEGNLVNKLKFKIQFANSVFSYFLASNEKLVNTKVVENFEIFNFCFKQNFI